MKKFIPFLILVIIVSFLIFSLLSTSVKLIPFQTWYAKSPDNLATIIGYLVVASIAVIPFTQWQKDQSWKQREAVLDRIATFNDTPGARNARLMLDWPERDIPLYDNPDPKYKYYKIRRHDVALALLPPNILPYDYTTNEAASQESAIRDSFEDLLRKLEHSNALMDDKLVKRKTFDILMKPLIDSLQTLHEGNDEDKALLRNFYLYIHWRKFDNIKKLLKKYKIDNKNKIDIDALLKQGTRIAKREKEEAKWDRKKIDVKWPN